MSIRIVIADDQPSMIQKLQSQLADEIDIEIVGIAKNGEEAIRLAKRLKPDLILMDVEMPSMNGIEATGIILNLLPRTIVLALSMHADRWTVNSMLKAGAKGYLTKDCLGEELTDAIFTIHQGQTYLSTSIENHNV